MTAIQQAYASNAATPIQTLEFINSSISGSALRISRSYFDLIATDEAAGLKTWVAAGFNLSLPDKTTDGRQDLDISIDNTNLDVWNQLKSVVDASRTTEEKVIVKFRSFLEADLSSPAGPVMTLVLTKSSINRNVATLSATYTPLPDTTYPRLRYYATQFPGLKYV